MTVLSHTPFCVCTFFFFHSPQSDCILSHNFPLCVCTILSHLLNLKLCLLPNDTVLCACLPKKRSQCPERDDVQSHSCVCVFAIKRWQCHTAVCACLSERYHRQCHTAVGACLPEKDGSVILLCLDVCHKDMAVSYCCVWMFAIKRWNCSTAVCACLSERDGSVRFCTVFRSYLPSIGHSAPSSARVCSSCYLH